MNKKNILPQQAKPVLRITNGQLPSHLAELSEEALGGAGVDAAMICICSFDGVDAAFVPTICSFDGVDAAIICICSFDGDA